MQVYAQMIIIVCSVLGLTAGYLYGTQRERDRQHAARRAAAAAHATASIPEPIISDREWERFVIAIYDLADGADPTT